MFNTRAATLPLGIWANHSVERRYQHSWTLLDPFNTPHSDIGSSHRRRSAIKYTHRFWCVSNVAIHLDCDVFYLDVQSLRTDATIFSIAYWRRSPTSRWSPYSTSTMINGILSYHRVVGDTNDFSSVSSIRRSTRTKKRFEMCSILERQHCRSVCRSTIVWRNDINTLERYLIRATPHTTTLSHLIDVESRLNILIVFGGVSKVATRLDYDVWHFDVHLVRGRATIV